MISACSTVGIKPANDFRFACRHLIIYTKPVPLKRGKNRTTVSKRTYMLEKKVIIEALQSVSDVDGKGDIVSSGRVSNVSVDDKVIKLTLALPTDNNETRIRIENDCRKAISAIGETADMMVMIRVDTPADAQTKQERASSPFDSQAPIPGVHRPAYLHGSLPSYRPFHRLH